jgi:hypothetical protein
MLNGVGSTNRLGAAGLNPIARFNPASLFAGGEQGAWYDPSNFGTMYQDVQGTTAVTGVEQAVGLILDSRFGLPLGSERITNNTFATDTDWTKGTGWSIGSGVATKTAGSAAALSQSVTLVAGTTYRVVYTITRTAGSVTAQFTGGSTVSGTARSAAGTFVDFLTAVSGNNSFEFSADATFAGTVDNVYVKAVSGNDAYQITSASRPTLRARYNLLTYSEQFDQGVWVKGSTTVVANNGVAPDGTTTADLLYPNSTGTNRFVWISGGLPVVSGGTYTLTVYAKAAGVNWLAFGDLGAGTPPANMPFFDLQNGVVGQVGSQFSSATITSVGGGWYRCSATGVRASTLLYPLYYLADGNNTATVTASGTNGVLLWGAQVFSAADQTSTGGAYQRIAAATDYVTVSTMGGTVFNPYLAFDGSDDSLLTNSVNFSATDKMTVWGGVTKLSDAAVGTVAELSNGTPTDRFTLRAPQTAAANYGFTSGGSVGSTAITSNTYATPTTNVLTGTGDIAADSVILRVNGIQAATSSTDQGTGNYGNYPLYIGRRGGTTLPFNGRLYQLIVRGAESTASQIGGTEQYVAGKTGVAL